MSADRERGKGAKEISLISFYIFDGAAGLKLAANPLAPFQTKKATVLPLAEGPGLWIAGKEGLEAHGVAGAAGVGAGA